MQWWADCKGKIFRVFWFDRKLHSFLSDGNLVVCMLVVNLIADSDCPWIMAYSTPPPPPFFVFDWQGAILHFHLGHQAASMVPLGCGLVDAACRGSLEIGIETPLLFSASFYWWPKEADCSLSILYKVTLISVSFWVPIIPSFLFDLC